MHVATILNQIKAQKSHKQQSNDACQPSVYSILAALILTILVLIYPIVVIRSNNTPTAFLETRDATQPVFTQLPLYMVIVKCTPTALKNTQQTITRRALTYNDIYSTVEKNNAIFVRSNTGFNWRVAQITELTSPFCVQDIHNDTTSKALQYQVKTSGLLTQSSQHGARIVLITPMLKNSTSQTTGFAVVGDTFATIDPSEFINPSTTLAHELGHTLNLTHPFNENYTPVLDLPRICTPPPQRADQLASCPKTLSTCGEQPEQLTNVMDYLPVRCSSRFFFSPMQVQVMRTYLGM